MARASIPALLLLVACGSSGAAPVSQPLDAASPDDGGGGGDAGSAPPTLAIDRAEDLGPQNMPATIFGRDGGQSARVGTRVLWTYGDTFLNTKAADGSTVRSATAAWGDLTSPTQITDALDAKGVPLQFIPYTAAEAADNAKDAQTGWALWAGAPFDDGMGGATVLFSRVRRMSGGFSGEGVGVATLKAGDTVATRLAGDLFTKGEPFFDSGALTSDGYVYLYSCGFNCKVARTPAAQIAARAMYTFYDGQAWQADIAKAADVIKDFGGLSVRWNPYLQRFLATTIRFGEHVVKLRTAVRPEGPWDEPTVVLDDPAVMPPAVGTSPSYLGLQHAEFDQENGKVIVVGYSRPTGPFRGEIRFVRITLR